MNKQEILLELTRARIIKNKIIIHVESPFDKKEYEFVDFSFIQLDNQFFIFNDYKSVMLYDFEFSVIQASQPHSKDLEQHLKSIPKNNLDAHTGELNALTANMKRKGYKNNKKDDIF